MQERAGAFPLDGCSQSLLHPLHLLPAGPIQSEGPWYLLTVDELVVKEKKHPLLALGLRLCDASQLP